MIVEWATGIEATAFSLGSYFKVNYIKDLGMIGHSVATRINVNIVKNSSPILGLL